MQLSKYDCIVLGVALCDRMTKACNNADKADSKEDRDYWLREHQEAFLMHARVFESPVLPVRLVCGNALVVGA